MVRVSPAFRESIYKTERTTKSKVSFEIIDLEAYEDVTVNVSGEAIISRFKQTVNKVRDMSHRYATFERNYFLLDGHSYIPPKATEGNSELGWWSDVFSGQDGTFAVPPTIELTFLKPHTSVGFTLRFDKLGNEYAADFRIEAFNASNGLILAETITGNTNPSYYFEAPLEGYQRLLITILKWGKPLRRARLVEVDFGMVEEFTGEKLISLKVVEEMDLLSSVVPSNEMEFTLDNSDHLFNVLNPDGIHRFLKVHQKMSAEIGLLLDEAQDLYEYVPMGEFYLAEWTMNEGAMTATFIGRDIFSKLEAVTYTNLLKKTNLYDLAVDVLTQAKITDYQLDTALKKRATEGFQEPVNAREALQLIAIAGKSIVKQTRDGRVIMEHFDELTTDTGYITFAGPNTFAGMTVPQVDVDFGFHMIDFESAFEIPKITLGEPVLHLVFNTIRVDGEEVAYTYYNPNTDITEGIAYEINNPLINTEAHAAWVAEWMFREYNATINYQATWRQNPALECGDVVIIEDNFSKNKKSRITKQEFNFLGYLEGVTEAKGGI